MTHQFNVELAVKYGLLEAIILENLYFWIEKNKANDKNFNDGRTWTYNSVKAFSKLFPYASAAQIRRALKKLEDEGLIMTGNYSQFAYDHTTWYALTDFANSIFQNQTFDLSNLTNRSVGFDKPITDNNTYINTDNNTYIVSEKSREKELQCEKEKADYSSFRVTYNEICKNLPSCRTITTKRKTAIKAFLKDFTPEQWKEICIAANDSAFLTGKNKNKWRADFDFLLRTDKAEKVLEGSYGEKSASELGSFDTDDFFRAAVERGLKNET